jgi:hypothetical protein
MTTKNINWIYLFKHCGFTLLLGPIVSEILMYTTISQPNKIVSLLEVYPIAIIFSLFFSLPTYILYAFLYYYLARTNITLNFAKVILISFAVIGVISTTFIIKGSIMKDIAISYSIASIITGIFLQLKFTENQ